jgi:hypothetical protein
MIGGSQVVSIVIYYLRDLPMGLAFKIYATPINIPKETFRGSKYEKMVIFWSNGLPL